MAYSNTGGVSPEHQNVDWKEKWDDEFLKWTRVCHLVF